MFSNPFSLSSSSYMPIIILLFLMEPESFHRAFPFFFLLKFLSSFFCIISRLFLISLILFFIWSPVFPKLSSSFLISLTSVWFFSKVYIYLVKYTFCSLICFPSSLIAYLYFFACCWVFSEFPPWIFCHLNHIFPCLQVCILEIVKIFFLSCLDILVIHGIWWISSGSRHLYEWHFFSR